jgi:hypothetical protein
MTVIDEGMQTARSSMQTSNADSPRTERFEPVSNVKFKRPVHLEKHDLEMVSIDAGIQMLVRSGHSLNADTPRTEILQPGSKVTLERCRLFLKQDLETV